MSGPKSMRSWYAGLRASGNGRTSTTRPTRTSTFKKSSKAIRPGTIAWARVPFDVEFNSGAFYPAAGTVELAEIAEERGFGAVWKGESNSTDPIVLLSAMAARTRTIRLGTAIYHVFGRSPVTMGIQAATLNDLSGGRLLLGLGVANRTIAGWHGGTFQRPLRLIREYVDITRAVARGERVEYQGEIYALKSGPFKLSWR